MVSFMAIFVAGIWATAGIWSGSPYDALINCVGILFIHDIDEQLFKALRYDHKKNHWNSVVRLFVYFTSILSIVFVMLLTYLVAFAMNGFDGDEFDNTTFCADGVSYIDGDYSGNSDVCTIVNSTLTP